MQFDALIVVSFGGPERAEEVMPFLENVTRGKRIPRERLLAVAQHYYHFDGRSPINDQNRALVAALRDVLTVPIFWGNRNWHPFLADTLREMRDAGVTRAAAFITSAFGSYSGCRQYVEDIARARAEVGPGAPEVEPLPLYGTHPLFIATMAEHVRAAVSQFDTEPMVVFTAHSLPLALAENCPYVRQLETACGMVADSAGLDKWQLAYQSRSGPPTQPWLEPDILHVIREAHAGGEREMVIVPIGFISDHMEVIYDLDTEAAALCQELGVKLVRAKTAGTHPAFIRMVAELFGAQRRCSEGCCPPPVRLSA